MREILFRGKRPHWESWVEGFYVHVPSGRMGENEHLIQTVKKDGRLDILYAVYPETVGQFTGLVDKAGKRIFEGDVCRFREWSRGEMCWIGNIHYENQQFVISGGPNKECETPFSLALSRFVSENIEVIGAIYDNSELLEVTPDA